jgi:hypothetical protein
MFRTLLWLHLLLWLPSTASAATAVKVELVSLPAAKSVEVQRAKRAVGERPLTIHAMQAELLPDGQVRTRCAPALPDLRRFAPRSDREPLR